MRAEALAGVLRGCSVSTTGQTTTQNRLRISCSVASVHTAPRPLGRPLLKFAIRGMVHVLFDMDHFWRYYVGWRACSKMPIDLALDGLQ